MEIKSINYNEIKIKKVSDSSDTFSCDAGIALFYSIMHLFM
ncbi:hypothetical protein CSB69_0036 [Morganella morganii]|nr:hypothetical protein CSB69_0036 [Morganella morganii]EMP51926.1 hypothetical protein C790_00396 [Morganella morganii SC01]